MASDVRLAVGAMLVVGIVFGTFLVWNEFDWNRGGTREESVRLQGGIAESDQSLAQDEGNVGIDVPFYSPLLSPNSSLGAREGGRVSDSEGQPIREVTSGGLSSRLSSLSVRVLDGNGNAVSGAAVSVIKVFGTDSDSKNAGYRGELPIGESDTEGVASLSIWSHVSGIGEVVSCVLEAEHPVNGSARLLVDLSDQEIDIVLPDELRVLVMASYAGQPIPSSDFTAHAGLNGREVPLDSVQWDEWTRACMPSDSEDLVVWCELAEQGISTAVRPIEDALGGELRFAVEPLTGLTVRWPGPTAKGELVFFRGLGAGRDGAAYYQEVKGRWNAQGESVVYWNKGAIGLLSGDHHLYTAAVSESLPAESDSHAGVYWFPERDLLAALRGGAMTPLVVSSASLDVAVSSQSDSIGDEALVYVAPNVAWPSGGTRVWGLGVPQSSEIVSGRALFPDLPPTKTVSVSSQFGDQVLRKRLSLFPGVTSQVNLGFR